MNRPSAASTPAASPAASPLTLPEQDAAAWAWLRAHEGLGSRLWTAADADWATREARRRVGGDAPAGDFIATRARLGGERLAQRGAGAPRALVEARSWRPIAAVALFVALLVGWGAGAVGPQQRINILAPPLLVLLLWNLAAYAVIALQPLWRGKAGPRAGRLRAGLVALASRVHLKRGSPNVTRAGLQRFLADWSRATGTLQSARASAILHAAAAVLAAAALAALYARGLAFEYRAGWDSTFLSADTVHRLLSIVLGPASALSGLPLPGVDELERLRFSSGDGENAARWIHLQALTLTALVIVPRLLLAGVALAWARRASRAVPVADGPDLRRLLQSHRGHAQPVQVVPFSYHAPDEVKDGLRRWLASEYGEVDLRWTDPVTDVERVRPAGEPGTLQVALLALTATPERETHGAFLQAIAPASDPSFRVVIDESGFRRRFPDGTGAGRRQQRRQAWERLLADLGHRGDFIDLANPGAELA